MGTVIVNYIAVPIIVWTNINNEFEYKLLNKIKDFKKSPWLSISRRLGTLERR